MDVILTVPLHLLQTIFGTIAGEVAASTQFVRRQGKINAAAFARVFCLGLVRLPKASLEQLGAELRVTASALCQRIQQPATAQFLRALLTKALGHLTTMAARRSTVIPLLRRFRGVYLSDSTTLTLPASLARTFAGCGGGAGSDDPAAAAAAKVLLRIDLETGQATDVHLGAARTPDIRLLRQLPALPPGALHIADLGFFDADYLAGLTAALVWWLTRLPARICVRGTAGWQELADWLTGLANTDVTHWDGRLEVGKLSPVRARVLVERCPPEMAARRRQALYDRMRKKGKTPGRRQLVLCDWWVLATNLPPERLRPAEASALYRSRWQLELVFKRWKSIGQLSVRAELSAARAECELYGRLLGVLVVNWLALTRGGPLAGHSVWRAWQVVWEMLDRIVLALAGVIPWDVVRGLLANRLDRIAKQPRRKKRPSTRQRLLRTKVKA